MLNHVTSLDAEPSKATENVNKLSPRQKVLLFYHHSSKTTCKICRYIYHIYWPLLTKINFLPKTAVEHDANFSSFQKYCSVNLTKVKTFAFKELESK